MPGVLAQADNPMRSFRSTRSVAIAAGALALFSAGSATAQKIPPEFSALPIRDGQIERALGELDKLAAALLKKTGIPGLAVAVVRDGRTVYAKGFGIRKAGSPETVDTDTVFQIASLSKPVTATMVARQVEAGAVAWNTPVVKHLPWFRLKDPFVTTHVTIGDLLSHRSGLPDHGGDDLEDLGFNQRQILERLRFLPLAPFRISYAYTNFGYTAAAEAVAAASGKDFATLSEDALFKPLGMKATSARFADFEKQANRAVNHVKVGSAYEPKFQRRPDAQAPAGGVSSSVNDMARWLAMVAQGGKVDGRPFIDAKVLLPAMSAQSFSSPAATFTARPGFYGYGFNVGVTAAGRMSFSHSGGFDLGAATNFVILPSANIGIVVLTNAAPIGAPETLAAEFMDLVQFGKIEHEWFKLYSAAFAAMAEPIGSLVGKQGPEKRKPAITPAAYAGTYVSDYYGTAQVIRNGDELVLKLGPKGIEYPLRHWDGNEFIFKPASENSPEGSISLANFKTPRNARFGELTIEYLDQEGLGTFQRK